MQILEWQNLIFLVPIAFGALYLLLMALGLSLGEHGADTDLSHDADASFDHGDVDLSHDVGVDHDLGADHDVGVEHDADLGHAEGAGELQVGVFESLIGFLGVGKVPLTILLMSYCFVWGGTGLIAINVLGQDAAWPAIGIAAAAAVFGTRYLAAGLGRLIPSVETYHTPQRQLVGLRGEVLYEVTETSGVVRVCDDQENLRDVAARVGPGTPPVPAGTAVVLQRYNGATKSFLVER
jgi:hypothetical protein